MICGGKNLVGHHVKFIGCALDNPVPALGSKLTAWRGDDDWRTNSSRDFVSRCMEPCGFNASKDVLYGLNGNCFGHVIHDSEMGSC